VGSDAIRPLNSKFLIPIAVFWIFGVIIVGHAELQRERPNCGRLDPVLSTECDGVWETRKAGGNVRSLLHRAMAFRLSFGFVGEVVMRALSRFGAVLMLVGGLLVGPAQSADESIPQLLGSWSGKNHTISDKKGLLTRDRTVTITEQTDRRFRGHFIYSEGRKDFFGVIYPDNVSFTWVASDSKGYNHGRILGSDRISACYVEPGEEATAGCADLARIKAAP
jgi:hypothetical protein